MKKEEKACALHDQGYNCAQSVLMAMTDHTGLTEELSASLAAGFGGGAGCRELCGAISGSLMTIGSVKGAAKRPEVMALDRELISAFREHFGAVRCEDLKARKIPCADLIAFAAEKTESLLSEGGKS